MVSHPTDHAMAARPTAYVHDSAVKSSAQQSTAHSAAAATAATPQPAGNSAKTTVSSATVPAVARNLQLFASPAAPNVAGATAATNAGDAAVLARLAAQPTAVWFGGWNMAVQADVNGYVSAASTAGKVPVLVAYNIPDRDCGGQSAGGAADAAAYASWIQSFAAGIGNRRAIVIVEPDSVAADCFDSARAAMLSSAVQTLRSTGASIYLDAGNPTWRTVADMSSRLSQAGIAGATGFSLNVSNFQTTASNIGYGTQLSAQLGGKHFVIDTSRNGNGPSSSNEWCNPAGRALGALPTLQTGNALVDAYLWVKVPGESDGACGTSQAGSSAPAAGVFWPQYALMLARNAGW